MESEKYRLTIRFFSDNIQIRQQGGVKMKITLRAARVNSGHTLMEAAKELGINKDTLSRYQKDSSDIPRSLLMKIEKLYCVDCNNIFFGNESDFFRILKEKEVTRNATVRSELNNSYS